GWAARFSPIPVPHEGSIARRPRLETAALVPVVPAVETQRLQRAESAQARRQAGLLAPQARAPRFSVDPWPQSLDREAPERRQHAEADVVQAEMKRPEQQVEVTLAPVRPVGLRRRAGGDRNQRPLAAEAPAVVAHPAAVDVAVDEH